jgi:hypothetical protein
MSLTSTRTVFKVRAAASTIVRAQFGPARTLLFIARRGDSMKTLMLAVVCLTGCATAPTRKVVQTATAPDRIGDSASERIASQRASDPKLHAEDEETRWGIEQNRQRKEEQRLRRARQKAEGRPGVDVSKTKDDRASKK